MIFSRLTIFRRFGGLFGLLSQLTHCRHSLWNQEWGGVAELWRRVYEQ